MDKNFSKINISIIGGDKRDLYVAKKLLSNDFNIKLYGFEKIKHLSEPINVEKYSADNFEDILKSNALILPMPGIDNDGYVYAPYSKKALIFDENLCSSIKSGIPIFVGVEKPLLRKLKERFNLSIYPVAELDDVAIYNSISTAEGALNLAIENSPITIHGSKCLVLGFGRVGITMARMLKALGSKVIVVARDKAQIARAYEMGCDTSYLKDIDKVLLKCDFIFNTIPSLVLDASKLKKLSHNTLIIDLASSPGGIDFKKAEKLGIKAIFAPGLPGKVAPESAGNILGKVYLDLLNNHLVKGGGA